jgi:hypothetical protein
MKIATVSLFFSIVACVALHSLEDIEVTQLLIDDEQCAAASEVSSCRRTLDLESAFGNTDLNNVSKVSY